MMTMKKKLLSQNVTLEENFASGPHILKGNKVTGKQHKAILTGQ